MSENIAIFGATGTAGHATALALCDAGHTVVAIGRSDPQIREVQFLRCAVDDAGALTQELKRHRIDALVSCIASRTGAPADAWAVDHRTNLRILEAAQAANLRQFVLLSAICVQKPLLAFQHAKLAFEAALEAASLTHSIVRPTAFFKSLSGQVDRLRAGKPYLMFGDGALTACKPISDRDLGRFIEGCLTDPTRQNAILPIGGPGPALKPRQMGAALFEALELTPRYRQVSPKLISAIAGGLGLAGRVASPLGAKAELARIGHYYATQSMLVWDPVRQRYDADATPEFGSDLLFDHYRDLAAGRVRSERGDHAVF